MWQLAFRNIFRQRMRTALTLAAIVFGVVGIVLSGGFVEDVFVQLRESTIHSYLGHLQVHRAGYAEYGRRDPLAYLIEEPTELERQIAMIPGVEDVMARLSFSGLLNNGKADLPIIGEGIEPEKEARLGTALDIVAGRKLAEEDAYGVELGQGVATALQLAPGDFVTLVSSTPDGAVNSLEFEVIGTFRTFSKDFDGRAVRIPLAAAQELLYTDGAHGIVVALADTALTDTVAATLRAQLPAADYELKPWYELAEFYAKTVDLYRRQFGALQLIVLVMVLLSVGSSVNMTLHERTGEFGTLQALGQRRWRLFRLILAENLLLGLLGAALGVACGVLLAWLISRIGIPMPPPPGSNVGYTAFIRIVPAVLALGFTIGAASTLLAALLPARRITRVPVVDALRQNV
ncbi:MAG: ABC transporter permease [Pseudomonadales bacterium]|jgi:putative ABC transport system permease protein|nr:ABC transporter permease [Pseudomonadales bacterium]MCP5336200.1 ABC transporter permease [Pseudomonadales bacterium]